MEKSLKNKISDIFILFWVYLICMLPISCRKEMPRPDHNTFIKIFQSDSIETPTYISQLPDGGFHIICIDGATNQPVILKIDKNGNFKFKKHINKFFRNSVTYYWTTVFTCQDPRYFAFQDADEIIMVDTSGNISYSKDYGLAADQWPGHLSFDFSNFVFPSTDGGTTSAPSTNRIIRFDSQFKQNAYFTIPDDKLSGHTLSLNSLRYSANDIYTIGGNCYALPDWNWNSRQKIFLAKITSHNTLVSRTIIDSGELKYTDNFVSSINTSDSGFIILSGRSDVVSSRTESYFPALIRLDKNLNILWEKNFQINDGSITPLRISMCKDGGFFILGSINKITSGLANDMPFVIKTDKNGNEEWEKTIPSPGKGSFIQGIDLAGGGYALVGQSNAFGNLKTGQKIILLKTDAKGNYY